ncbi:hypothetical protein [Polyangium fumosum]|uniref:Uncharacterized protein n=1 Tax=Polyangium fumosum TaxID=889272 RepID=A0A4U1J373_9BACT|nr:hypothetical protein [Polyangium fumosum]TKD01493.1 hypothetical protein E8A74_30815 [Polyangium fumosum]
MDVADPIPPSVQALMDLFANELSHVSFPGVDRAILEQVVTEVRTHTEAVVKAEAALEAARTALRDSEETLSSKTQKALAYARVYADDHPDIRSKVDSVARIAGATSSPPGPSREANGDTPKRRGRPPKAKAASAEPAAEPTDATPADASPDATPAAPPVMELGPSTMSSEDPPEPSELNGTAHPA